MTNAQIVTVTLYDNSISFGTEAKRIQGVSSNNYKRPSSLYDKAITSCWRSKSELRKDLLAIDEKLDYFTTLSFSLDEYKKMRAFTRNIKGEKINVVPTKSIATASEIHAEIRDRFKKDFPTSYYIWVMELAKNFGPLHFHLYIKDNHNNSKLFINDWFYEEWIEATEQYDEELVFTEEIYEQKGISHYCFQRNKADYLYPLHVHRPVKGKGTKGGTKKKKGIINKKLIPFKEPQIFKVSLSAFEHMIDKLISKYIRYCKKVKIHPNEHHITKLRTCPYYNHVFGNTEQYETCLTALSSY